MKKHWTPEEQQVGPAIAQIFERCPDPAHVKLENFPKYVRRQHLKRFITLYEIFKLALPVKGSIVECGVFRGFGLMSWAKLCAMFDAENLIRQVYGFDTFAGFPTVSERDRNNVVDVPVGGLYADSYDELGDLIVQHDKDRFLGHIPKVRLIKGDVCETIPAFLAENPHVVVSLLFLDMDLYAPTKAALKHFLPRMPKGAVLAFDELDNAQWPGETLAAIEEVGLGRLRLQRMPWDPYIAYAILD